MSDNPFDPNYVAPEPKAPEADKPRAVITTPGMYPDVTCAQYFSEPCPEAALNHSTIKLLYPEGAAPEKAAYHHPAIGLPPEERKATIAQYRGKLVHRLALDKGEDYEISPFDDYRSKEARDWKAKVERNGKMPVKKSQFDEASKMADIARAAIRETTQGFEYLTEVVIAWTEEVEVDGKTVTIWCRAMIDVWCPALNLALDVKTAADALDDAVLRQFSNGYATQDVWYLRGLGKVFGNHGLNRFGFLFVESDPPHLSRTVTSTESFRFGVKGYIETAMEIFARCMSRNEWPGYEPFYAYPPDWMLRRWDAAEQMRILNGK